MSSIAEIMAQQARRIAIRAAEAAKKKPQPDYVYREPMPTPPKATTQGMVAAFIDDRTYDSKPAPGRPGFNADSIRTLQDVHRVLSVEQPEEYMMGRKSDFGSPAAQFGRATGEGYPPEITGRKPDDAGDPSKPYIAEAPTDEMFKAWAAAESEQKRAAHQVKREVSQPATLSVQVKQEQPAEQVDAAQPEPANEMGISLAQQQMLTAMRAMRQRNF